MYKYNCEKLITAISRLQSLSSKVDLAIGRFEPTGGLAAKEDVLNETSLLNDLLLSRLFRKTDYEYFVQEVGRKEWLENRIIKLKTTGKSGLELLQELRNKGVEIDSEASKLLRSPDYKISKAGEVVHLLCLSISEITDHPTFGSKNYSTHYSLSEVASAVEKLGLGFLSDELAADLLLAGIADRSALGPVAMTDGVVVLSERALDDTKLNSFLCPAAYENWFLGCKQYGRGIKTAASNSILVRLLP
jgi:hypothetical protein